MIERLKGFDRNYFILYILFLYVLFLPIAKVAAIQNILVGLFIIIFFSINYNKLNYKSLFEIKTFFIIFGALLSLALISTLSSFDYKESLNEIRSEFLKPLILFVSIFLFVSILNKDGEKKAFLLLGFVLLFHTCVNIGIWIDNGGWPARTGGLLDGTIRALNISAAGERFGIWTTYSLAFAISLLFSKYKKYGYLLIFIVFLSIIANHTRATFIGTLFIVSLYFIFFYKNKLFKIISIFIIIVSFISFIFYSKNLSERFNVYNMISHLEYLGDYSPSEFRVFEDKFGLGHSTVSRLAMWKSVIEYRLSEPFIPQSYGRFLYSRSLKKLYENNPENIPYVLYAQAHSDFMSMLFSLGIVGLIFFILLLTYVLRISYVLSKNNNYKSFGVFIFLGTIGYIASMMFGSFFGDSEILLFYILLGATLSLYLKSLSENSNEKTKIN